MTTRAEYHAQLDVRRAPHDAAKPCRVHWSLELDRWVVTQRGKVCRGMGSLERCMLVGCSFRYDDGAYDRWFADRVARGEQPSRKVFAWVHGWLVDPAAVDMRDAPATQVRFNPHRSRRFHAEHGCELHRATLIEFHPDGTAWARGPVQ